MNKKSKKTPTQNSSINNSLNSNTGTSNINGWGGWNTGNTTTITTSNNLWGSHTINTSGYITLDRTEDSVKNFLEFICEIIGIDMTYEKFIKLTKEERMQFLRDSKIKDILK